LSKLFPYETLWERALIDARVISDGPIHIGSGERGQVLRIKIASRDSFVVTSNSLKGVMRSLATRIANAMSFDPCVDSVVKTHQKGDHRMDDNQELKGLEGYLVGQYGQYNLNRLNTMIESAETVQEKYSILASFACPICRLFGSKFFASKVVLNDLVPTGSYNIGHYISNAISRSTRTAEKEKLYSYEFVNSDAGVVFNFKLLADNLSGTYEGKLFANLLRLLVSSGLRVGGLKSKGYGTLKFDQHNSKVFFARFKIPASRQDVLFNLKALLYKEGHEELSVIEYANKLWL
jgi:CRISPR/Cas system CSM-associated protein Csm3 (group 7 of RAMP superfamily)